MKNVLSAGTESRKVIAFLIVFAVSSVFLWFGKVGPDGWIELTKWGAMTLFAGLTAEHFAPKPA